MGSHMIRAAGTTVLALSVIQFVAVRPAAAQQSPGPAERASRPITMEQAIDQALAANVSLAIADERAEIAAQGARGARSRLWPQLMAEAGYLRSTDPVVAFGTKLRRAEFSQRDFDVNQLNHPDAVEDWSADVAARWTLLDPRVWAGASVARHQARSARWSTRRTREATRLQTRVLYYRALHAMASLGAAQAAEAAARATYRTFRQRREQGLLTEADVLQAEAELSAAEAARTDAERARLDALQDLGQQLGWEPDTLPLPSDTLKAPEPLPEAGFEPQRRADLLGLSAAIEAADAAEREASLGLVPAVDVSAVYTKHAGGLFSSDATDWTVNVALRWTLFSGFGRFAGIQRTAAQRRIARLEYADAVRRAQRESEEAERAIAAARKGVEATANARSAAEAARDLMKRRFQEGLATATDLLQAEARARDMRNRAIAALAGYHIALARLEFVRSQTSPGMQR